MKRWRLLAWGIVALCAGFSLNISAQAADKFKVGFVYVGPVGDHGWSYQHHEGLKAVQKAFGDKVETTYAESVSEGPDAERVITQMAQKGADLIFATSFGYMNPVIKVAKRFPKVKFEHATGFKRAKNVSTYNVRFYEGRYAAGIVAGRMTKTNTLGYIASFPIPEVVMGINATYLGAKSVNPNIKLKIVWVSSWFDPGKETAAAKALRDQGVDVMFQHTDSAAPMKLAQQEGIYAIGQASDMHSFGPDAQLTSLIDSWNPYYIKRVKEAMEGTWKSEDVWGGINSGMLSFPEMNKVVPAEVAAEFKTTVDAISAGKFHPFTGPLKKQDGTPFLADGEVITDGVLASMNFYIEGVEGSLPK
ncbi:MAG: BMP family ABC transporter substrate-binding protein [Rhodospirillales bacterium]|nr:BMP family ABC transporter substrate-binding protein [Rhodospirillales bacterium]